jgi:hypothetical protein
LAGYCDTAERCSAREAVGEQPGIFADIGSGDGDASSGGDPPPGEDSSVGQLTTDASSVSVPPAR